MSSHCLLSTRPHTSLYYLNIETCVSLTATSHSYKIQGTRRIRLWMKYLHTYFSKLIINCVLYEHRFSLWYANYFRSQWVLETDFLTEYCIITYPHWSTSNDRLAWWKFHLSRSQIPQCITFALKRSWKEKPRNLFIHFFCNDSVIKNIYIVNITILIHKYANNRWNYFPFFVEDSLQNAFRRMEQRNAFYLLPFRFLLHFSF